VSGPAEPKGIYLTTHNGAAIYVSESGEFSCTHLGERLHHHSLTDLKRRIRGREILPIRILTEWDVKWSRGEERPCHLVAQDPRSPGYLFSDHAGMAYRVGEVFHFDAAVLAEAHALRRQRDDIHAKEEGLMAKLRPVTLEEIVVKKGGTP
jgi:hypothetical protein